MKGKTIHFRTPGLSAKSGQVPLQLFAGIEPKYRAGKTMTSSIQRVAPAASISGPLIAAKTARAAAHKIRHRRQHCDVPIVSCADFQMRYPNKATTMIVPLV